MVSNLSSPKRRVSVAEVVEQARDRLRLTGHIEESFAASHWLNSARVQKLGLALSGFADSIHSGRIQIYGNSERSYIARLSPAELDEAYARLDVDNISCILLTAGVIPTGELLRFCEQHRIPLYSSPIASSEAVAAISEILSEALAPSVTIHGVLMDVYGIGVLLVGDSGIGKSECALDLISRGQRLISDDSVMIKRVGDRLIGSPPESIRDYLEIRGLGILNARQLFGVSALSDSGEVKFCIEFASTDEASAGDRLGLEPASFTVLDVSVPKYPIPVVPGRNLATLVEAAVRVFVSRQDGNSDLEQLIERHTRHLTS